MRTQNEMSHGMGTGGSGAEMVGPLKCEVLLGAALRYCATLQPILGMDGAAVAKAAVARSGADENRGMQLRTVHTGFRLPRFGLVLEDLCPLTGVKILQQHARDGFVYLDILHAPARTLCSLAEQCALL